MNKLWGHFSTITRHKIKVGRLCFRCGLYRQGITHDLSKYSWVEFKNGVKYFQGNRSPIDREKEVVGYSAGWLHHKGRNKHHWEYWIDLTPNGFQGMEMPKKYVAEMFCDRIAASMIYLKENYQEDSALKYYEKGKDHYLMHENTRTLLEKLLKMNAEKGLETTIQYIRREVL